MTVLVIMVPFVLLASLLVMQFAVAYYGRQVLAGAAQDGAATAALDGSSLQQGVEVATQLAKSGGGKWITDRQISGSSGNGTVTITVTGTAIQIVPIVPAISLSATATATVEQFTPQSEERP